MILSADIPKLYTAFAEWLSCLAVVLSHRRLLRHSHASTNVPVMAGILALLSVIQIITGMFSNAWWLVGMLTALAVMFICLYSMLRISAYTACYTLARAFMWAELTASLEWQLDRFYVPEKWASSLIYSALFCLVIYTALFLLFISIESHYQQAAQDSGNERVSLKEILQAWSTALFFFTFSNLSYVEITSPFSSTGFAEIFNTRTIHDLAGVIMLQLLYVQKAEADRREEVNAIRNVLHTQYMQFRQSQDNIELINEKYHDLKHQLQLLRMNSINYHEQIDEIEKEIRIYESDYHTGSSVLDTILTSKGQLCLKYDIRMYVVADGSLLDKVSVVDLAAVFGNALDNAIEHELQIPEKEKRLIRVNVSRRNEMVCILIENYFQGTLLTEGTELVTTKADKQYHGYGIKSIRHTVQKYGGFMTAAVEDNWFRLKILLPRLA
ncbi:MAG: GHKL domain-containing protein [Eubacteriales bacterium]|nr:GHKL domain-containing protein [Eubacteriales bacterium]